MSEILNEKHAPKEEKPGSKKSKPKNSQLGEVTTVSTEQGISKENTVKKSKSKKSLKENEIHKKDKKYDKILSILSG